MSDLIVIKTFLHRHEAELVKGLLENEGIKCTIMADDSGGMYPGMSFGSAIKLSIHKSDAEKARAVLDSYGNE